MAVKHITGCKQVVTFLNRFDHGISTSQLQEMETCLAQKNVQAQLDQEVYLLPSIQVGSWMTLCWDYNDICKETLSGKGTTHCTNGIAIQRRTFSPIQLPVTTPLPRSHRRSIAPVFSEVLPSNAEGTL